MSEVLVMLADGFEEIEGLTAVDLLRRAGIETTTVSIMEKKKVVGSHGIIVKADEKLEKADFSKADMIVLPGGLKGTANLKDCEAVTSQVQKFAKEGKWVAAICAAPTILGELGLLEGKEAICYPTMIGQLTGAKIVAAGAVRDGQIITGRGMGASTAFALTLIEALRDRDTAEQIAKQVVYTGEF